MENVEGESGGGGKWQNAEIEYAIVKDLFLLLVVAVVRLQTHLGPLIKWPTGRMSVVEMQIETAPGVRQRERECEKDKQSPASARVFSRFN